MKRVLPLFCLACAVAGCSWAPDRPAATAAGDGGWGRWEGGTVYGEWGGADGRGGRIVEVASQLIGTPYRWGGDSPDGFDCSGLVVYAFREGGAIQVPRTSHEQFLAADRVPIAAALPGDLVFFGRGGRVSHVGIYLGDERFIHAPESGQSVKISSMAEGWYRARFAGAGRFR